MFDFGDEEPSCPYQDDPDATCECRACMRASWKREAAKAHVSLGELNRQEEGRLEEWFSQEELASMETPKVRKVLQPTAASRVKIKDLPSAEARFYRHIVKWASEDFDDTTLESLNTLIRECTELRTSKVPFPITDEPLVRSLDEEYMPADYAPSIHLRPRRPQEWTFGYVARMMQAFFMIDVEEGHYHEGKRSYNIKVE
jgi:hypothetical protein